MSAQPDSAFVWRRDDLLKVDLSRTRHLLGLFGPCMQFESDRAKGSGR